jgi:hypothetical protein
MKQLAQQDVVTSSVCVCLCELSFLMNEFLGWSFNVAGVAVAAAVCYKQT